MASPSPGLCGYMETRKFEVITHGASAACCTFIPNSTTLRKACVSVWGIVSPPGVFQARNTPGGDTIPQTLTQAFLNVVEFGMNVQQAAEAPCAMTSNFRVSMYPQSPGDGLAMPQILADRVGAALRALGHPVQALPLQPPYGSPS